MRDLYYNPHATAAAVPFYHRETMDQMGGSQKGPMIQEEGTLPPSARANFINIVSEITAESPKEEFAVGHRKETGSEEEGTSPQPPQSGGRRYTRKRNKIGTTKRKRRTRRFLRD